jgi:hypothetical protein
MKVIVHLEGEKLVIAMEEAEAFLASFGGYLETGKQAPDSKWHLHGASPDHQVLFRYGAVTRVDIENDASALGAPIVRDTWK